MTQTNNSNNPTKRSAGFIAIPVSIGIAYLMMSERYRIMTDPENRFSMHWNNQDSIQLMLATLLLGGLIFAAWQLVSRFGGNTGRAVGRFALVATVGWIAAGKLHAWASPPQNAFGEAFIPWRTPVSSTLLLGFLLLAILALIPKYARIAKGFHRICVIMVIVFIAESIQSTAWTGHKANFPGTISEPYPMALTGEPPKPDVLILLFDSWSWDFTFGNELDYTDIEKRYPNLASLLRQATIYTDAHSLGTHTTVSIPRLLYQTTDDYVMQPDGNWLFENKTTNETSEPETRTSLFQVMRNEGYRTFFAGWGPWDTAFEQGLDSRFLVQVYPFARCKYSFPGSIVYHLGNGLLDLAQAVAGPLQCRWRAEFIWRGQVNREYIKLTEDVQNQAKSVIRNHNDPCFSIMFHGVPHFPFIFDASGARESIDRLTTTGYWVNWRHPGEDEFNACLPNYKKNLAYVDTLIGDLLRTLKERGKYDSTLLIISSDHAYYHPRKELSFDSDEALFEYRTHVPLIIKIPHQESGSVVTEHTTMLELGPIIQDTINRSNMKTFAKTELNP